MRVLVWLFTTLASAVALADSSQPLTPLDTEPVGLFRGIHWMWIATAALALALLVVGLRRPQYRAYAHRRVHKLSRWSR